MGRKNDEISSIAVALTCSVVPTPRHNKRTKQPTTPRWFLCCVVDIVLPPCLVSRPYWCYSLDNLSTLFFFFSSGFRVVDSFSVVEPFRMRSCADVD